MQIKEARGIYQSQIKSYSKTASELRQKQKELEEKLAMIEEAERIMGENI